MISLHPQSILFTQNIKSALSKYVAYHFTTLFVEEVYTLNDYSYKKGASPPPSLLSSSHQIWRLFF